MTPQLLAALSKAPSAHKYDHGHALVLAGGVGRGGAARLAARAALRVGAGLVTVLCPASALLENAMRLEAVMCAAVDGPEALAERLSDRRVSAVCVGPGLGLDRVGALVPAILGAKHQPATVLDADALTGFVGAQDALFERVREGCVLTPHEGEFARLFPDLVTDGLTRDERVLRAAARAGGVVVLKGPETVIADPLGQLRRHTALGATAVPWLATAGSGDVLAGLITGLLARGVAPIDAAEAGVWLHAACARAVGPGLIAEDLPETLPKVLRELGV